MAREVSLDEPSLPSGTGLDSVSTGCAWTPPAVKWLGRTDYESVRSAMKAFTEQRDVGTTDEIWVTEHDPVYTLGVAGHEHHVLNPGTIPVVRSDRGGQVTYHGPGQVVVYPLLDLRCYGLRVKEYVGLLEQVLIDTLAAVGLTDACRKPGAPGVYLPWEVASDGLAKVAALGIKITRGCSWHGLALNVDMNLSPFLGINPCGYEGMLTIDLKAAGVRMDTLTAGQMLTETLENRLKQTLIRRLAASCIDPQTDQQIE